MEQAATSAKKLSPPIVSDVSDAFTNISDRVSDQQKLLTSCDALMKNFKSFVKIVDEVAKVHSFPSLNNQN